MDLVSVYVTCPDMDAAKRIARALLDKRLIACANLLPITSLYRWEGAIQEDAEVAMFCKTRRVLAPEVERAVRALHPYSLPCIVVFDLAHAHAPYLAWVHEETNGQMADGSAAPSGT